MWIYNLYCYQFFYVSSRFIKEGFMKNVFIALIAFVGLAQADTAEAFYINCWSSGRLQTAIRNIEASQNTGLIPVMNI